MICEGKSNVTVSTGLRNMWLFCFQNVFDPGYLNVKNL